MVNNQNNAIKNKICLYCGTTNMEKALFCTQCGVSLAEIETKAVKKEKGKKASKTKKKTSKKKVMPIVICMAVFAMICAGIIAFTIKVLPNNRQSNELFYLKDNELYMAKGNKYIPELVTDSYYENDDMISGYEDVGTECQYTEDDYIFYMQDIENGEGDLYYKKSGSEETETRIDFNVNFFQAYSKECVIYQKDKKLYFFNGKNKKKLTNELRYCGISENGEYLCWSKFLEENGNYTYTYDYHIQDIALKEEIIIEDVSRMVHMNTDYSEIYYVKDEVLYLLKNLEDVIKIDKDVWHAWLSETEEVQQIYYPQYGETVSCSVYDFVEDDMRNDESYDYIRESLKEQTFELQKYTLGIYSLDTREKKKEKEFMVWDYTVQGDIFIWYVFDINDVTKVKLSDIEKQYCGAGMDSLEYSEEYLETLMFSAIIPCTSLYLIADNYVGELPDIGDFINIDLYGTTSAPSEIYVNTVTNEIYMSVYYDLGDETTYDLYALPYNEPYAEWRLITNYLEDNMINTKQGIYYFTKVDEDGREGTLFLNGTEIDDDVYPHYIKYTDDAIYFIRDIDSDKEEGTLYQYKNNQITKIADDVAAQYFVLLENGQVAYFTDYSYGKNKGNLYVFDGKKSIEIDTDVSAILQ